MKVHILDDYFDTLRTLPSFAQLDGHDVTVWNDRAADEAALAERVAEAEVLVLFRDRTPITESLVAQLPNLKLVAMRGAHPHVDVDALTRAGVLFCSEKSGGGHSVAAAELTFALILAAARDLPAQVASARAGRWQASVGRSLNGRTLGLYGYGGIGRAVAGYAEAFGMKVIWWASESGRAKAAAEGETVADTREAFFSTPEVVSVHKRLTSETRGDITRDDLMAMRPDSIFVNTSRAGLIAPGALLEALNAGRPGTAALDVFEGEPVTDPDDPILSHPRVIPTPHVGFITEDELDLQFADIYRLVSAYAAGDPVGLVNPQVRSD